MSGIEDFSPWVMFIDHGVEPDWEKAEVYIRARPFSSAGHELEPTWQDWVSDYEDSSEPEPAEDRATQALLDELAEFRRAYNGRAKDRGDYEVREKPERGVDLHILIDYPNDPIGLWSAGGILDTFGVLTVLGFDS